MRWNRAGLVTDFNWFVWYLVVALCIGLTTVAVSWFCWGEDQEFDRSIAKEPHLFVLLVFIAMVFWPAAVVIQCYRLAHQIRRRR